MNRTQINEDLKDFTVIKRNGAEEPFDAAKIEKAVELASSRVTDPVHGNLKLSESDYKFIINHVYNSITSNYHIHRIEIDILHTYIESALIAFNEKLAKQYMSYKGYKTSFINMLDSTYNHKLKIEALGDRSNANTDGTLVTTLRCVTYNELNKELYKTFFLSSEELETIKDGYLYIHDIGSRLDTINCCVFDLANVLDGGFTMGSEYHSEPNSLDAAFRLIADIISSSAAMQYGGWSCTSIDIILEKYAKKSFQKEYDDLVELYREFTGEEIIPESKLYAIYNKAMKKIRRIFDQGFQSFEKKFNSVASSRGDYPFLAFSFGMGTSTFATMATQSILSVRKNGQGENGKKRPALFPKLNFLYHEELHGEGKEFNYLLKEAVHCSSKAMYPDYLSLSGTSYVAYIYRDYGEIIPPMGCRAALPKWFEKGGLAPEDSNDKLVITGRFNLGAISLHLPMILAKARKEGKEFYEVLDYYMNMARNVHKRTIEYLGQKRASCNPLGFCEGGFYGGTLDPNDKIRPVLQSASLTFGITALNELQYLYNGKELCEDQQFALDTMQHINDLISQFKEEDGLNYSSPYGTPAESLCGLQVEQFRKKYGIIKGVSDREYVSNSFHCPVWADIDIVQKQDIESKFWDMFNGGKIQYGRYATGYNTDAMEALIHRGMKKGFYQGINMSLSYCGNCGHEQSDMGTECPKCGSDNITQIDRMNGYLGYTRIAGNTRYNDAKNVEISERLSM